MEYNNNNQAQQQQEEPLFTVSILDFWDAFKKGWWVVLLTMIVVTASLITFKEVTFVPRYSSKSTLYILFEDRVSDNLTSAYSLSKALVSDCEYALKSQSVIDSTIEKIDFNYSASQLSNSIITTNPEDTRYIIVTVSADTPEHAQILVDTLCETCQEQMAAAAGDNQQVNVYAKGTPGTLCNEIVETSYIKYGVIAGFLVYAVFVLFRILDDRFRDDDDVESTLGLTILGTVPNADMHINGGRYSKYTKSSEYGKYGYYGNYGKQYSYYYGRTDNTTSPKLDSPISSEDTDDSEDINTDTDIDTVEASDVNIDTINEINDSVENNDEGDKA